MNSSRSKWPYIVKFFFHGQNFFLPVKFNFNLNLIFFKPGVVLEVWQVESYNQSSISILIFILNPQYIIKIVSIFDLKKKCVKMIFKNDPWSLKKSVMTPWSFKRIKISILKKSVFSLVKSAQIMNIYLFFSGSANKMLENHNLI